MFAMTTRFAKSAAAELEAIKRWYLDTGRT